VTTCSGSAGRVEEDPRLAGVVGIASAARRRLSSGSLPASPDWSISLLTTSAECWSAVVVVCAAEIDVTNVAELRAALRTARRVNPVVVADMSRTVFCDASAARALLAAHKRATASGGELRVAAASPELTRILGVLGVDQLFRVFPSVPGTLSPASEPRWELPATPYDSAGRKPRNRHPRAG
jgi:anti-sigma B factor antagonist